MSFRLLLLAAAIVPLFGQDADDVTKFLMDFRARFVAIPDDQAAARASLTELTARLEAATAPGAKVGLYRQIAVACVRLKDTAGAIEAVRAAHLLEPSNGELSGMLAMLLAADNQMAEASAIFAADAGDGEALVRRADQLLDEGQKDLATACLRQAQKLLPDDEGFDDRLGIAYLRAGRIDDALRELNLASGKAPGSALLHLHLAYAFAQKDYRDYAGDELNRATACHPSDEIRQGIQQLRAILDAPR